MELSQKAKNRLAELQKLLDDCDLTKAKPCPFCGSENINKILDDYNNLVIYCRDCGGQSGTCVYGEPLELWNSRAISSQ